MAAAANRCPCEEGVVVGLLRGGVASEVGMPRKRFLFNFDNKKQNNIIVIMSVFLKCAAKLPRRK